MLVEIDSIFGKVPQYATGALKKHGFQAIDITKGGKTTKIHARVTENFQLIELLLTGGHVNDSECAIELLSKVNLEAKIVLGDKAFCSEKIREYIQEQRDEVRILIKSTVLIKREFNS